jgi:hypothetical protein
MGFCQGLLRQVQGEQKEQKPSLISLYERERYLPLTLILSRKGLCIKSAFYVILSGTKDPYPPLKRRILRSLYSLRMTFDTTPPQGERKGEKKRFQPALE